MKNYYDYFFKKIINKIQTLLYATHSTKKLYKSKAVFIDSGLLYRYLTLAHLKSGKKKINIKYLIKILGSINIVKLQNPKLNSNLVSNFVSKIAQWGVVLSDW